MIYLPDNYEDNNRLRQWLESRMDGTGIGEDCMCAAVIRDEKILAVTALHNYRKTDVEIAIASESARWISKEVLKRFLSVPFDFLKTQRCTAYVLKSNKRCRKLLLGIGFREEGKHRHYGPHLETVFSYGLTEDDYRNRYG